MTQQEILNSSNTKTWKMRQLFALGLTRQQVANLVGTNYGFAHNVYIAMHRSGGATSITVPQRTIPEELFRLTNFTFNHKFGIEIEGFNITQRELVAELSQAGIATSFEGYSHETRNNWKVVTDGSLRGSNTFELVSPILEGEPGLQKLKTATLITKGLEGKVNKTCGLHVHLDARDFDRKTWIRIFKNYAILESKIDKFMANSRRGNENRYCQSINTTLMNQALNIAENKQELQPTLQCLSDGLGNNRYTKVNIKSFWRHGSIEFRQHQGTMDYEKMKNWILFLARLVEFSKHEVLRNDSWEEMGRFLTADLVNYYKQRTNELN